MGADSVGFKRVSRMLIAAMVAVVSSVLASSLIARFRLSSSSEAVSIATNAAPSIRQLTNARRHLHHIEFALDQAVAMPRITHSLASVEHEQRLLDAAVADYLKLPRFADEGQLQDRLRSQLGVLETALASALARLHAGDAAGARPIVFEQLDPALEETDEYLAQLVELNSDHLARDAAAIHQRERSYDLFVYLLFGGSSLLAVVATLLVVRAVRRYFTVLDRRSKELEYFAIQIGHDVLNPLTPVSAALRIAQDRVNDDAVRTAVERGMRGVDRIQRNISGLLAFARTGEPSPPGATARMKRCIESVVADLSTQEARILVDGVEDTAVRCADGVLARIVRAMVADALVRSEGEAVHLRAVVARGRVRLEVTAGAAAGPGVDLFAPRIRGSATGYPGIELEMLTARHLAETHGGRVGTVASGDQCVTFVDLPQA